MNIPYKIGDSKIHGKGLIAVKNLKPDDLIGLSHINNEATPEVGRYHNHSDRPNAVNVKIDNERYLIAESPIKEGDEITVDYRKQPDLEQPEDFMKEGGSLPKAQEGKQFNTLEADLISKVLMNRNRDKDFVQRAYALGQNPNMFSVPDPDQFGSNMSHKMAWGEDEFGQAYMYPTVMNPGNESIKVPNQYADYISSEGYKKATGMKKYGGQLPKAQEGEETNGVKYGSSEYADAYYNLGDGKGGNLLYPSGDPTVAGMKYLPEVKINTFSDGINYPYFDYLTKEEKSLFRNEGPIGSSLRAKALYGYGINGNQTYMDSVDDFVLTASGIPQTLTALQIPQSLLTESLAMAKGEDYNMSDAFGGFTGGKQRYPSDVIGFEDKPGWDIGGSANTAMDILADPTNWLGVSLLNKFSKANKLKKLDNVGNINLSTPYYHGSPWRWKDDLFDASMIGKGEGATKRMQGLNLFPEENLHVAPKFANIKNADAPLHIGSSNKIEQSLLDELNPTIYKFDDIGNNLKLKEVSGRQIKNLKQEDLINEGFDGIRTQGQITVFPSSVNKLTKSSAQSIEEFVKANPNVKNWVKWTTNPKEFERITGLKLTAEELKELKEAIKQLPGKQENGQFKYGGDLLKAQEGEETKNQLMFDQDFYNNQRSDRTGPHIQERMDYEREQMDAAVIAKQKQDHDDLMAAKQGTIYETPSAINPNSQWMIGASNQQYGTPEQKANTAAFHNNLIGISAIASGGIAGGGAIAPYLSGSLAMPLPFMGSVPGATYGNLLNSYFASDFLVNRAPNIPGQINRGEYTDAAVNIGFGALDLLGVGLSNISRTTNAAISKVFKGQGTLKKLDDVGNINLSTPISKFNISTTDVLNLAEDIEKRLLTDKFIKNNMKATGRSREEVINSIQGFSKQFDNANVIFDDLGEHTGAIWNGTDVVMNTNKIDSKTRASVLGHIEHEIEHIFSDVGNTTFKKSHPTLKVSDDIGMGNFKASYYSLPYEQQVRFRKSIKWLEQNAGLKLGDDITDAHIDKLSDALKNWSKSNAGKDFGGIGGKSDVYHLLSSLDYKKMLSADEFTFLNKAPVTSSHWKKSVKDILNATYGTIPIGFGSTMLPEQRYGGSLPKAQLGIKPIVKTVPKIPIRPPIFNISSVNSNVIKPKGFGSLNIQSNMLNKPITGLQEVPKYLNNNINFSKHAKSGGEQNRINKYKISPFDSSKLSLSNTNSLIDRLVSQGVFTEKFKMGGEQKFNNGYNIKKDFDKERNLPFISYNSEPSIEGRIYYDKDTLEQTNNFNLINVEDELIKKQNKHNKTKEIIIKYENGEDLTPIEKERLSSLGLLY
jgi:hypothetical protein